MVPPGWPPAWSLLARLQRAFDVGHTRPGPRLAAGRSNHAVAGELVVTINTVKKHVSHILDKLGAANRTEAVAGARELGLIP